MGSTIDSSAEVTEAVQATRSPGRPTLGTSLSGGKKCVPGYNVIRGYDVMCGYNETGEGQVADQAASDVAMRHLAFAMGPVDY